jgi:Fe2+ or Zn2+ uptake regulation protein
MMATLEDLRIVNEALTSCKTANEIAHNVKLPIETVTECLDTLKSMGVISKDSFSDTYCPLEEVAGNICEQCNRIVKDLGGENADRDDMQDENA